MPKKKVKISDVKSEVLRLIDDRWSKFDKDRRNSLYINEKVKEHLVWVGSVINQQDLNSDTLGEIELKGNLPHIYECAKTKLSNYRNALFKSPESSFEIESDIDTNEGFATIQKHYLVSKMKKGKIFEAYNDALMKQIWRGESILFHEWGSIKGKKQSINPKIDETGSHELDENGQPQYEVKFDEIDTYTGVLVRAIEPHDFVFDTTKISSFSSSNYNLLQFQSSSCAKIIRTWMSLPDISSKYDISKEDEEVLKLAITDTPNTAQNFDDFTNMHNHRCTNGDMIEVLHWLGDMKLKDGTVLKDYSIITAASKVVLNFEESPYSKCPVVWMPDLVDFKTRRGISSLVVGIEYNDTATQMHFAGRQQYKFAVNPAFFAKKGAHPVNNKKKINPGDWVEIDAEIGDVEYPVEITSYKNLELGFNQQELFEKYIQKAVGTNNNMMGDIEHPNMTATQTREIITGGNNRTADDLNQYVDMVLIPSIEIISTMFAENTPIDKVEQIKIAGNNGQSTIQNVNDAIRKGNYNFTVGSAQTDIEEKAKLSSLQPIVQFLSQVCGTKFNDREIWNYSCGINDIVNPDRFLQDDPLMQSLGKYPPDQQQQIKQALTQIASNPQLIQKAFAPPPQPTTPPPPPQPNKIINDIAVKAINADKNLPDDFKQLMYHVLHLQPTTEMLQEQQKQAEQEQQKLIKKQQVNNNGQN